MQDPLKVSLHGIRDPYSDLETDFQEEIYPMEGEYMNQNLKTLKAFEIQILELPFTALSHIFPDPQVKGVPK